MCKHIMLKVSFSRQRVLRAVWMAVLTVLLVLGRTTTPAVGAQTRQVAARSPSPTTVTFEVATIKPHKDMRPLDSVDLNFLEAIAKKSKHGRFRVERVPLTLLIEWAYNLKDFQVVGLPSWANSDGYDISAKAEGDATFEQMRPMLQSLLAERFNLTFHRGTKELPVYELRVAKGGLKIAATKEGGCIVINPDSPPAPRTPDHSPELLNICGGVRMAFFDVSHEQIESIEAFGISMPKFVEMLSSEVGRTTIDKTAFTESFDVHLRFAPDVMSADNPGQASLSDQPADSSAPSIFYALQEQLGLRLQSARGPVEILAIDHVERPSEN
jgi:uncharacterized protein (TIGR03435 family)